MEELLRNNINLCLFSETKLDETFPNQQFKIRSCETVNVEGLLDDCEVTLIELTIIYYLFRVRSLLVSDLRFETKGSWSKFGC